MAPYLLSSKKHDLHIRRRENLKSHLQQTCCHTCTLQTPATVCVDVQPHPNKCVRYSLIQIQACRAAYVLEDRTAHRLTGQGGGIRTRVTQDSWRQCQECRLLFYHRTEPKNEPRCADCWSLQSWACLGKGVHFAGECNFAVTKRLGSSARRRENCCPEPASVYFTFVHRVLESASWTNDGSLCQSLLPPNRDRITNILAKSSLSWTQQSLHRCVSQPVPLDGTLKYTSLFHGTLNDITVELCVCVCIKYASLLLDSTVL
jgi:hypothetical protein